MIYPEKFTEDGTQPSLKTGPWNDSKQSRSSRRTILQLIGSEESPEGESNLRESLLVTQAERRSIETGISSWNFSPTLVPILPYLYRGEADLADVVIVREPEDAFDLRDPQGSA